MIAASARRGLSAEPPVNLFQALHEAMRAVDPAIPPGLPPHVLDPVVIAAFFGIPLEDMNWKGPPRPAEVEAKLDRLEDKTRELFDRLEDEAAFALTKTTTPACCQPQPALDPSAKTAMLTVREAAVILGCSYGEARKKMLEGRIRAVKDGRWLRTRPEWVEEYVASHVIKPVEASGTVHELPVPSRRKSYARVKLNGIGHRFLRNRAK
jgi:excisionase family DNA binding protein